MAKKGTEKGPQAAEQQISAVEATNHYNRHVEGFNIDVGMEVLETREVIAGVSLQLPRGEMAFIPAEFLRALADEAEESTRRAIARANGG